MSSTRDAAKRTIRVCYWDSEQRIIGAQKAQFESLLRQLGDVELVMLKRLDDPKLLPCDLLVVAANHVPEEEFSRWLDGIRKRIAQQNLVWLPTLVLAEVRFATLADLLDAAHRDNWYFDVVASAHLDSLPLRVANLLRVHDHLHELTRYSQELTALQTRISEIEDQLAARSNPEPKGR